MKKNLFIFPLLFCMSIFGQEKTEIPIHSNVSEATVFINGAQITRKKTIDLPAGRSTLKFAELSPYIDNKSVQVKANGEIMILSVNQQLNYTDSLKQSGEIEKLLTKETELNNKLNIEKANLEIVSEEITFLHENKNIGGSNVGVNLTNLKETANYYRERISALKLKEITVKNNIETIQIQKSKISQQLSLLVNIKPTPMGEVVVKVDSKNSTKCEFVLSYFVNNAGWYPSYDIRANTIEDPIELIYKANVHQNTKEEWKNIKLKVSSANPISGNVAPELKPYFLNYYTKPPRYDAANQNNQITGKVIDSNTHEPLVGASVTIKGTTIGTICNADGSFSLSIPNNGKQLEISYIGYEKQILPISGSNMNILLKEQKNVLNEVAVVGYGVQSVDEALQGRIAGLDIATKIRGASSLPKKLEQLELPTNQVENQTNVEFEIKIPYTVNSDNKNLAVEVDRYNLAAQYEYYCVPKIDKDAFLLANIVNWEKYNLLEGEANIFFENTFVGKTILDVRATSDTLSISLGRDKNVIVSRENAKDSYKKQFWGNKKEETKTWQLTVKNNKKQPINFVLLDQIPVSTMDEIEVIAENLSNGALNKEKGEVKWKLELKSGAKKEFELKYKIRFPKTNSLNIE